MGIVVKNVAERSKAQQFYNFMLNNMWKKLQQNYGLVVHVLEKFDKIMYVLEKKVIKKCSF